MGATISRVFNRPSASSPLLSNRDAEITAQSISKPTESGQHASGHHASSQHEVDSDYEANPYRQPAARTDAPNFDHNATENELNQREFQVDVSERAKRPSDFRGKQVEYFVPPPRLKPSGDIHRLDRGRLTQFENIFGDLTNQTSCTYIKPRLSKTFPKKADLEISSGKTFPRRVENSSSRIVPRKMELSSSNIFSKKFEGVSRNKNMTKTFEGIYGCSPKFKNKRKKHGGLQFPKTPPPMFHSQEGEEEYYSLTAKDFQEIIIRARRRNSSEKLVPHEKNDAKASSSPVVRKLEIAEKGAAHAKRNSESLPSHLDSKGEPTTTLQDTNPAVGVGDLFKLEISEKVAARQKHKSPSTRRDSNNKPSSTGEVTNPAIGDLLKIEIAEKFAARQKRNSLPTQCDPEVRNRISKEKCSAQQNGHQKHEFESGPTASLDLEPNIQIPKLESSEKCEIHLKPEFESSATHLHPVGSKTQEQPKFEPSSTLLVPEDNNDLPKRKASSKLSELRQKLELELSSTLMQSKTSDKPLECETSAKIGELCQQPEFEPSSTLKDPEAGKNRTKLKTSSKIDEHSQPREFGEPLQEPEFQSPSTTQESEPSDKLPNEKPSEMSKTREKRTVKSSSSFLDSTSQKGSKREKPQSSSKKSEAHEKQEVQSSSFPMDAKERKKRLKGKSPSRKAMNRLKHELAASSTLFESKVRNKLLKDKLSSQQSKSDHIDDLESSSTLMAFQATGKSRKRKSSIRRSSADSKHEIESSSFLDFKAFNKFVRRKSSSQRDTIPNQASDGESSSTALSRSKSRLAALKNRFITYMDRHMSKLGSSTDNRLVNLPAWTSDSDLVKKSYSLSEVDANKHLAPTLFPLFTRPKTKKTVVSQAPAQSKPPETCNSAFDFSAANKLDLEAFFAPTTN